MKKYAVIQHKTKRVDVFNRKMDATFFHAGSPGKPYTGFNHRDRAVFKEITNIKQLPKGYKVIDHNKES